MPLPRVQPPSATETHISTLAFMGDRAFKRLKPVNLGFLDFSTTELRLAAVDDEIRLNQRMAPDVYLGFADVVEQGEVVDRLIVMRRLPDERRLSELLTSQDIDDCVRSIARSVATFHAAQAPILNADSVAGRDAVARNWSDNFAVIDQVVGDVLTEAEVAEARDLVARDLDHRGRLLAQRMADCNVRDGHGDLTAEDIFCLADGPRILDCLAFDPKLRIADVLLDVAFLAMDLDRLGRFNLSQKYLHWYSEFSNEHHPAALAHHFVAYRANVRVKVAAIRYLQGDQQAAKSIHAYSDLCFQHLKRSSLRLIMVGGTPGTGKTTLALGLSDSLGAVPLSSDAIRKERAGIGPLEHDFEPPDQGIYGQESTERTYATLLDHAGALLDRAESVVLDASWNQPSHREAAKALAAAKGADLFEFECVLDALAAKRRIAARLADGSDASDVVPELVDELRSRHKPWTTATPVDTRLPPAKVTANVVSIIERR